METKEIKFKGFILNGFLMLFILLLWFGGVAWLFTMGAVWSIVSAVTLFVLWFIFIFGFSKLEPNEAIVMIFFGKYIRCAERNRLLLGQSVYDEKETFAARTQPQRGSDKGKR